MGALARSLLVGGSLLLVCDKAHATYSLLIADSRSGQLGSVGTSCTGSSAVSRISGLAPGFGAIHAQAQSNPDGRDRGVMMLEAGATAEAIISAITAPSFDFFAASRQYGVVTLAGSSAGYTGSSNMAYADDRQATLGDYVTSYQGNILTSKKVLDQLAASLERAEGCDLPDTLMLALEAGADHGEGDSRCTGDGIPADAGFLKAVTRDGTELVSIEVTAQSSKGAVAALRERFDSWRAAHPCARPVPDASELPPADASTPPADASTPVMDAATQPRDAAVRDAATTAMDAALRDAGSATSRSDASADSDEEPAAASSGSGCGVAVGARGAGMLWLLAALCLVRRARRT